MKFQLLLLMLCVSMASATAQRVTTDKVPPAIMQSFRVKFPYSQQQSWAKSGDSTYTVVFFNGKKKQSSTFHTSGNWLNTETEIQWGDLPKAVVNAFGKQFPGFQPQDVLELETSDRGIVYELIVSKGVENYYLEFSPKGELLKKEAGGTE